MPEYGTVEYYANLFADIICDAQASDPHLGDNMIDGFKLAMLEWRNYHEEQLKEYNRLNEKI